MNQLNIQTATYNVCGLSNFTLSEALTFWKAKFQTIKHFKRDVIKHPALDQLGSFVEDVWNEIIPISVEDALREQNVEKRRVMFDCIGVRKLFQQLEPELLDLQEISKVRIRWDEKNVPYIHDFADRYELHRIEGTNLFKAENKRRKPNDVFAVRCWCTTTAREYWIYVPEGIALGGSWLDKNEKPDAIRAIAWTIRIDVSNPLRIFRQGGYNSC
jgi:hypothetical protein